MSKVKQMLFIEDELLKFVELFGATGEYDNVKLAYTNYKSHRYTARDFKKSIVYYISGSCRNVLQATNGYLEHSTNAERFAQVIKQSMHSSSQTSIHREQVYSIVDDIYHYKKYYTSNENEYGEYNESKIYNTLSK